MRIGILGYGAVASVHARQLCDQRDVVLTAVYGPNCEKAAVFASTHKIAKFTDSMESLLPLVDAVIICSPSNLHYEQARLCIESGLHTLVELPPCESGAEAQLLERLSLEHDVILQCAHTSRYLSPYLRIADFIRSGKLGSVHQVNYLRHHVLLKRSWTDDALLHHAAHLLDLLIHWFGDITPQACAALPQIYIAQTVSLLGTLSNGAPATIAISYASHLPRMQMVMVGDSCTIETDGFSYIESDLKELKFSCEGQAAYEEAIRKQDAQFVDACQKKPCGVGWQETVKLIQVIDHFRMLGGACS